MQSIFGLSPNSRMRAINYLRCNLFSPLCRQTVHKDEIFFCIFNQVIINLIFREKYLFTTFKFIFFSNGKVSISYYYIRITDRFRRIRCYQ